MTPVFCCFTVSTPSRDVLAAHADDIAAPLRGVEQQRQREARLGADRMMRLELRDLVLGPSVESVALDRAQLDVPRRVRRAASRA